MAKSDNKSPGVKELILNNILLLAPLFTYMVFKYFKENFFEGYAIQIIEFFFMIVVLTLVYSFTLKNICGKTNKSAIIKPLQHALILSFILKIINIFNPCKEYMTNMQANIFFGVLLITIFNVINYFLSKEKDNCKKEENNIVVIFLLILHAGLIYMKK
jgi:hypothetical protein